MKPAIALILLLLIAPVSAFAQAPGQVLQSGRVTPGHCASWTTNGVVQDCGGLPLLTTTRLQTGTYCSFTVNANGYITAVSSTNCGSQPVAGCYLGTGMGSAALGLGTMTMGILGGACATMTSYYLATGTAMSGLGTGTGSILGVR